MEGMNGAPQGIEHHIRLSVGFQFRDIREDHCPAPHPLGVTEHCGELSRNPMVGRNEYGIILSQEKEFVQ